MQDIETIPDENKLLQAKYKITSLFYDVLDYPWERQYRKWRPDILKDVRGSVIEVGVGTGRNLKYYDSSANVTGVDLSKEMLRIATKRSNSAKCNFHPVHEDASSMKSIHSNTFDWLVSTFLCCVMPDHLQPIAIEQFARALKPGARFRILEMIFSKDPKLRKRQERFSHFVQMVYGARFDRNTLLHIEQSSKLKITNTYFVKSDVYLVIEGFCDK